MSVERWGGLGCQKMGYAVRYVDYTSNMALGSYSTMEQQKRAEEACEVEPLASNFEERQDISAGITDIIPMVFIKKWIKTKHAMLFRLSNGTIQVLFYDLTEVLISSEGKLVTFVDKDKNRFVLSIAEIANKQHGDVSRRLKFAKEIPSQLISASQR